jgi:tRNA A-37 threonylcarbamoyl transferase component Bud32
MRRFGPFELVARLGRGGSAEVWRAILRGPHGFTREVALKRLLPERLADAKVRDSLLTEARLAARLTHPNVAQVLEVVEAAGEPAIVMELVDGCDLRTLMRDLVRLGGPPPPGLGAFVAHEVCRALGAAHAERPPILHRDVSSTNVLVSRDGTVKLADFGIGKALEEADGDGRTASLKGNLGYMAPEQLARAPLGPSADVYAAGVLLWEMLTGRRLLSAALALDEAAEARRRPIVAPSTVSAAVPPELDAVVARATAHDAQARFVDGAAMAEALAPWMHQLGFGPTRLAALVRDHAPPPPEAEPVRHTMTGGAQAIDDAATEVDAAAAINAGARDLPAPRRVPWLLVAALTAGAALGVWLAWPLPVAEVPPPPAAPVRTTAVPAPLAPTPLARTPIVATPIAEPRSTSRTPARVAHPKPARTPPAAAPASPPPAKAPDFVDGKLVNPFKR